MMSDVESKVGKICMKCLPSIVNTYQTCTGYQPPTAPRIPLAGFESNTRRMGAYPLLVDVELTSSVLFTQARGYVEARCKLK